MKEIFRFLTELPRIRLIILIGLIASLLVMINYSVELKRPKLTPRQEALMKFGEGYFRPCMFSWKEPPQREGEGSTQAYLIYVDGKFIMRLDKGVKQYLLQEEGQRLSVRASNSKAESDEVSISIPQDCLPLPKLP